MGKCQEIGCTIKRASFNYPDQKSGLFCSKHKRSGMIDVKNTKCEEPGCIKQPSFNYPEQTRGIRCSNHKQPGMIDVKSRKCQEPGCTKQPSFNYHGETQGIKCFSHKQPGMVDVKNYRCEEPGCTKHSNFNYPGQSHGIRCSEHKQPGMINISHYKCEEPGCTKRPSFNYPGQHQGIKCFDHKQQGMINVVSPRCQEPGCTKQPSFNYSGETRGIRCSDHRQPNMVDVVNPKCEEPGCTKHPKFNHPSQTKGIKCSEHKQPGMINVVGLQCQEPGCTKYPSFNYPGEDEGIKCLDHKESGMTNVKNVRCKEDGCLIRASYGKINGPKEHCAKHRNSNEYLQNHPKCATLNCKNAPIYTDKGDNYPRRCEDHKFTNDKNVMEKPCIKCKLPYYINETTLMCNICADFFINKREKIKEQRVITFLESNGFKLESTDRRVEGGCTLYRPDTLIDFVLFETDVEIDEYQHENYPADCEIIRMIMIYQDFGGKPVIFIRFNPDSYQSSVKSVNYNGRERILLDLLNSFRNVREIKYPLLVCYLFYDGFDGMIRFRSLDPISRQMTDVSNVFV